MKVSGFSLKTAKYAGYKGKKMIILVFLISGACAGLAGVGEITGPIGQLHREISPDYGFTAIIVAFLGRFTSCWYHLCITSCCNNLFGR